jgi:outer membrane immunogenic protein
VNELKAGINYRFGGAALPSVASASQPLLPPPAIDWTGCYLGVHAGGGIIDDTFVPRGDVILRSATGGGAVAGGQIGCNSQTGIMVFGIEGEAAWSNLTNRFSFNDGGISSSLETSDRNRWNADLAARKAGVAAGRFDFFETDTNGGFLQGGTTLTGLLLGTGIEYAFAPNWSLKLEYNHVGYLSRNVPLTTLSTSESTTTNIVKAGINYKFFGPSAVVVVARD